jgi:hypothetical protein
VDADLHDTYGIDVWDEQLLTRRPWPWLRNRVLGLLACDSRIARAVSASSTAECH